MTYILANSSLRDLSRDTMLVARSLRKVLGKLGLRISPNKSKNFIVNPFCLGRTFVKLARYQENVTFQLNKDAPEQSDFEEKWNGPEGAPFRLCGLPFEKESWIKIISYNHYDSYKVRKYYVINLYCITP